MNDPRYARFGSVEVRLMEECAELIRAVSKAVRFGWSNWHPEHPEQDNRGLAQLEMADLVRCWNELAERELLTTYYATKR